MYIYKTNKNETQFNVCPEETIDILRIRNNYIVECIPKNLVFLPVCVPNI